jgi:hypothetical protein
MAKFEYRPESDQEKPAHQSRLGHGRCEVYGCPRDGHIHTGQWNCRYHFGKSGQSLSRITLALKNHEREINWHEHVLNATVTDFGMGIVAKHSPHGLHPVPDETLSVYKLRMQRHVDNLLAPQNREIAP